MAKGVARSPGLDKKHQTQFKKSGAIPKHIAIIMDGNGRWAKNRSLPRVAGHHEGVNSVREIVRVCGEIGVRYLTLYTFSTENWKRPQDEVSILMRLLVSSLRDECENLNKNNVRLKTIGDFSSLPENVQNEFLEAIELTKHNTGLTLILALSYSGRWDINNAIKRIAEQVQEGNLQPQVITDEIISNNLSTKGIPDPDLLVRTSGELRLSNFLLWQLAYSEIYVTDVLWPDFRREELYDALESYQQRERRFGLVSEQIRPSAKPTSKNYVRRLIKSVSS